MNIEEKIEHVKSMLKTVKEGNTIVAFNDDTKKLLNKEESIKCLEEELRTLENEQKHNNET